jgi:hypothetical protein
MMNGAIPGAQRARHAGADIEVSVTLQSMRQGIVIDGVVTQDSRSM